LLQGNTQRMTQALVLGADLESPNSEGLSPLYWSLLTGHTALCDELLKMGARLDAIHPEGHPESGKYLFIAALKVGLSPSTLVERVLDTPVNDQEGRFILAILAQSDLAQSDDDTLRHKLVQHLLQQAAEHNVPGLVHIALSHGAKLNEPDGLDGLDTIHDTPLEQAIFNGHQEVADTLLSLNAEITEKAMSYADMFPELKSRLNWHQEERAANLAAKRKAFKQELSACAATKIHDYREGFCARAKTLLQQYAAQGDFEHLHPLSHALQQKDIVAMESLFSEAGLNPFGKPRRPY